MKAVRSSAFYNALPVARKMALGKGAYAHVLYPILHDSDVRNGKRRWRGRINWAVSRAASAIAALWLDKVPIMTRGQVKPKAAERMDAAWYLSNWKYSSKGKKLFADPQCESPIPINRQNIFWTKRRHRSEGAQCWQPEVKTSWRRKLRPD